MEQYWMPKELDFENLRICLDEYAATSLYIRLLGLSGGTVKVKEKLEGRELDFKKNDTGLYIIIDSDEVFHFPLKDYEKGFSLAYERVRETEDGIGRIVMLSHGVNPYDSSLPEPAKSTLRTGLDGHLMEIEFEGRVNLKFHSRDLPWEYWVIDKANNISNAILKQQIEYGEEDS